MTTHEARLVGAGSTAFETVNVTLDRLEESDRIRGPKGPLTFVFERVGGYDVAPPRASLVIQHKQSKGGEEEIVDLAKGKVCPGRFFGGGFGMCGDATLEFDSAKNTRFWVTMTKVVDKAEQRFEATIELNKLIKKAMERAGIQADGTRIDSELGHEQPLWAFSGYEVTFRADMFNHEYRDKPLTTQLHLKFDPPSLLSRFNPWGSSEQTVFFTATRRQERLPVESLKGPSSTAGSIGAATGGAASQIDQNRVDGIILMFFDSLDAYQKASAAAIENEVRTLRALINSRLRPSLSNLKLSADIGGDDAPGEREIAYEQNELNLYEAALQQMQARLRAKQARATTRG